MRASGYRDPWCISIGVILSCPRGGIGRRARFRFSLVIKDLCGTTWTPTDYMIRRFLRTGPSGTLLVPSSSARDTKWDTKTWCAERVLFTPSSRFVDPFSPHRDPREQNPVEPGFPAASGRTHLDPRAANFFHWLGGGQGETLIYIKALLSESRNVSSFHCRTIVLHGAS